MLKDQQIWIYYDIDNDIDIDIICFELKIFETISQIEVGLRYSEWNFLQDMVYHPIGSVLSFVNLVGAI